jgi:hypothetical protein
MHRASVHLLPGLADVVEATHPGPRDRYHVAPDLLRAGAIGRPCRIDFVITPKYSHGAATELEPLSRATGAYLLAENAVNLKSFGGTGLAILSRVLEGARCYRLHMGDLHAAVRLVDELVAA